MMYADGWAGGEAPPAGNPPGLTTIAYRAGDFASFRRALLSPLPGEQQLTRWSPGADDLGLQALEWWAYLADILTFYNERIANGSYLATTVGQPWPRNAAGLVRLLGYISPPVVTATGVIAAIRSAAGTGGELAIPAGLQVSSTPTADVPAQQFEVTEGRTFTGPSDAIVGLPPDPALFRPVAGQDPADGAAQRTVLLAGLAAASPGDQYILVNRGWDGTTADWAVVTAGPGATEQEPDGQRNTRLTLSSADWHGLPGAPAAGPAAGPPLAADYQLQRALSTALLWTMSAGVGTPLAAGLADAPAGPSPQTLTVPLATVVRSLSPGDNVVFAGSTGGAAPRAIQLLAQVTGYSEEVTRVPATAAGAAAARQQQDVFITHTNLTVRSAGAGGDVAALRSVLGTPTVGSGAMRYGFRDVGTLVPTPAVALDELPVTVTVPADMPLPAGGRPVALQDASGTGLLVTATPGASGSATLEAADGGSGTLNPALRAPVRLLADLVEVSRGTTVSPAEVLGSGDPAVGGQAFTLARAPLVYLPPAEPGGDPASTLTVRVNGIPWSKVNALSGCRGDDTVYVVNHLPDGSVQIRFGDGVHGARLPLGVGNVTAVYRYGPPPPPAGPLLPPPAGSLCTVLQPQPNLATVTNPLDISPGTTPQTPADTAVAAPATSVQLPGMTSAAAPLITLDDSERIARTVTGVTRARACWTWDQDLSRPAVTVYVGSETGTAAAVTAVGRLFPRELSGVPLSATPARSVSLAVSCQLLCLPGTSPDAVLAAADDALTGPAGLFSPDRMAIGQRLYRSQVEAALTAGGLAAVSGLRLHPAGQASVPDEAVLDPGEDGYFSLEGKDLSIGVITR